MADLTFPSSYSPTLFGAVGRVLARRPRRHPDWVVRTRWHLHLQHTDPEGAVRMAMQLNAKKSVGVHWGTWLMSDEACTSASDNWRRCVLMSGRQPATNRPRDCQEQAGDERGQVLCTPCRQNYRGRVRNRCGSKTITMYSVIHVHSVHHSIEVRLRGWSQSTRMTPDSGWLARSHLSHPVVDLYRHPHTDADLQ